MSKKNQVTSDFRKKDNVEQGIQETSAADNHYSAIVKPTGQIADLYKNAKDQDQKNAILQANDIAHADSLAESFNSVEQREAFKFDAFKIYLKAIGYRISSEDPTVLEDENRPYNITLDLSTNFEMEDKTYRRVRKKVNFISTTSIRELIDLTNDVIDDGEYIPVSIRRTASSDPANDKIVLTTKKVYSFLVNLQGVVNKNDNRSFAIERIYEAIIKDFEDFFETAKDDDIYNLNRLGALFASLKSKAISDLDKAYEELFEYVELKPKAKLSTHKSGFMLEKQPNEVIRLFTNNTDVAVKFTDEQFFLKMLTTI